MTTAIIVGILFFLALAIIIQGLARIVASPPHKGIRTFLGKRLKKERESGEEITQTVDEGWHWFFIRPYIQGFIPVNVSVKDFDAPVQKVRATNNDECDVPIHFTYDPVDDYLIEFDNRGRNKGVEGILTNIAQEKLRQWARSPIEGPANGDELLSVGENAVGILLKAILGTELNIIPSQVPTEILRKYFSRPRLPLGDIEKIEWGSKYERVEKILEQEYPDEKEQNWPTIRTAIEERQKIIKDVTRGNGDCVHKVLGIRIRRLNIGAIQPAGEFKAGIEGKIKEERDRVKEVIQDTHAISETKRIKTELGLESTAEATEFFQIQQGGKINKTIDEKKYNVAPETRQLAKDLLPEMVEKWKGGKK